jgi:hypothetical protein
VPADRVVVATPGNEAYRLLDLPDPVPWKGVTCLYFAADRAPVEAPLLVLNGDGDGPVNNLCVPSRVAAGYAPAGRELISVTVLEAGGPEDGLLETVRAQLAEWFGQTVDGWTHLRTYRIAEALPEESPERLDPVEDPTEVGGVLVCGDHRDTASIQGALASGRRAAETLLASAPSSLPPA